MTDENIYNPLLNTATASQWQQIGVRPHHGIAIPLFSLHSQKSCGIGEYPDLLPLITWCHENNLDVIQLLPLNDTGLDTSPYSALSAYALNPIHLGLSQLPFVFENPPFQQQIKQLQNLTNTQKISYSAVLKGKEQFLRDYYSQYGKKLIEDNSYNAFKEKNRSWLINYALFKSLKIIQNWSSWELWPPLFKNPSPAFCHQPPENIAKEMEYHIFIQYHCFQQLEQVKKYAEQKGVFIKGDIPILINRESADVWHYRQLFMLQLAAGAPPDMYSLEGQKWGFPLYDWDAIAGQEYRWWIERLHVASQFYHIYRIDHIVGFYRIWAIPLSKKAIEGHFIPENKAMWIPHGELLMKMMINNCDMLPIGEDLGVVPPEVKASLRTLGICGTKVMRWERQWNTDKSFIDPKDYPQESMTTVSTHDSETLQLWWEKNPEEARLYAKSLGWAYRSQLSHKQRLSILHASHHSNSLFHINLLQEYLALVPEMTRKNPEEERINTPGIISEKNWTYRFRPSVEAIITSPSLKKEVAEILAP